MEVESIAATFHNYMPPHSSFRPLPMDEDTSYPEKSHPAQENTCNQKAANSPSSKQKPPGSDLLEELTGGIRDVLGGIFKDFSLKNLDSGDILLLLIILFLFLEGDNLDLVIALGLMFLLGFGSESQPST